MDQNLSKQTNSNDFLVQFSTHSKLDFLVQFVFQQTVFDQYFFELHFVFSEVILTFHQFDLIHYLQFQISLKYHQSQQYLDALKRHKADKIHLRVNYVQNVPTFAELLVHFSVFQLIF